MDRARSTHELLAVALSVACTTLGCYQHGRGDAAGSRGSGEGRQPGQSDERRRRSGR